MEESLALAKELAAGPTVALGLIRQAYWASLANNYEEQLHLERVYQGEAGNTDDFTASFSCSFSRSQHCSAVSAVGNRETGLGQQSAYFIGQCVSRFTRLCFSRAEDGYCFLVIMHQTY